MVVFSLTFMVLVLKFLCFSSVMQCIHFFTIRWKLLATMKSIRTSLLFTNDSSNDWSTDLKDPILLMTDLLINWRTHNKLGTPYFWGEKHLQSDIFIVDYSIKYVIKLPNWQWKSNIWISKPYHLLRFLAFLGNNMDPLRCADRLH